MPWTASIEPKPFGTGGYWYVVLDTEENGIGEFYGDDHEANAAHVRLAAAAPEMREALTSLLNWIRSGDIDGSAAVLKAEAALAKAEAA